MKPKIDDLIAFEVFKNFRPDELADVANSLHVIELSDGDALFNEGDSGKSMFFIHKGSITICRAAGEVLATLDAPTIFGEMAVLEHKPRSASAVAKGKAVLWEMDESELTALAESGSPAAYKIMTWIAKGLSDKLRRTNDTVHELNNELQRHARISHF